VKISILVCVHDALSNQHYTASNDWLKLNNELEKM